MAEFAWTTQKKIPYFVWSPLWQPWNMFWYILTVYLTSYLHTIWHCVWHFYKAFYQEFYLTFWHSVYTTFYLRAGAAHCPSSASPHFSFTNRTSAGTVRKSCYLLRHEVSELWVKCTDHKEAPSSIPTQSGSRAWKFPATGTAVQHWSIRVQKARASQQSLIRSKAWVLDLWKMSNSPCVSLTWFSISSPHGQTCTRSPTTASEESWYSHSSRVNLDEPPINPIKSNKKSQKKCPKTQTLHPSPRHRCRQFRGGAARSAGSAGSTGSEPG